MGFVDITKPVQGCRPALVTIKHAHTACSDTLLLCVSVCVCKEHVTIFPPYPSPSHSAGNTEGDSTTNEGNSPESDMGKAPPTTPMALTILIISP